MKVGVGELMNEHVWRCLKEIRRVISKIMYVGICIKREFWSIKSLCAPGTEISKGERDNFGSN